MRIQRILFTVFLLGAVAGCSSLPFAKHKFTKVWTARDVTVQERAAAVNRHFKKGTAISAMVPVLGTNYVRYVPPASVPAPEDAGFPATSGLIYHFGNDFVLIQTTAPVDANPLDGKFVHARYSAP